MSNIEKLMELLKTKGEKGEELAGKINSLLANEQSEEIFLARLNEIRKEIFTLKQEIIISAKEKAIRGYVLEQKKPPTTSEISKALGKKYKSLQHRTHASVVVNSLTGKGVLGKFRIGHSYYFTSPEGAVKQVIAQRNEIPEDCNRVKVSVETGLPLATINSILKRLMVG